MLFKPSVNLQQQRLGQWIGMQRMKNYLAELWGVVSLTIGSLFGSIPVATFGQNVGLVTVTKVINKYVLVFASVILLIAGFVPKVAALLTTIPYAVIGGATISVLLLFL